MGANSKDLVTDEGKFFTEELQLISSEEMVKLEDYYFSIFDEMMDRSGEPVMSKRGGKERLTAKELCAGLFKK